MGMENFIIHFMDRIHCFIILSGMDNPKQKTGISSAGCAPWKGTISKALQINEEIKAHEYNVTREVKTAVRNVMEYLRNESDFGVGDNSVIACERKIANCLKTIENNIPALCNTKTMGKTEKIIIENCKTIQINLKLRTERKKR